MTYKYRTQKLAKSKIFILTPNPFPIGNVSTNRFTTYAKFFASKNYDTKVLVLKGTEDPENTINSQREGVFEGVHYEYMAKNTLWNTRTLLIKKAYLYLAGIKNAIKCLLLDRPSTVIIYTNDLFYMAIFGFLRNIIKYHYIIDKSEYPVVHRRKNSIYKLIYLKTFKLFDGILVMTNELMKYYSTIKSKNAGIFLLPMSVDLSRFTNAKRMPDTQPYFGCVFGTHNRDCISDTIKAFYIFCDKSKNNDVRLKLVGDIKNLINNHEVLEEIKKSEFQSRIDFLGTISPKEIPIFLINAIGLITTPREYISGGFPTKLGEYLASGNPVIATTAGEVSSYLVNFRNCFLAKPGDVENIAELMLTICSSPELAHDIGEAGKILANQVFTVECYDKKLMEFIRNPNKK